MLAIHPGSLHSTGDVYRGIVGSLKSLGHEVITYPLNRAIALGMEYNKLLVRKGYVEKFDLRDVQYIAGVFALDRALHYDTEWVFCVSAGMFNIDFMIKLKLAGRKLAILFTESPYESEEEIKRAEYAEVVFTNERNTAKLWKRFHPNVHYIPHAVDPRFHSPIPFQDEPEVLQHDVVFVGTGWPERIAFFEGVNWEGIDFGLYGTPWKKHMKRNSKLKEFLVERPVPNVETSALYRAAKIGINLHRYSDFAESLNPRARELAACGVFYLSDNRIEGQEIFQGNVPIFHSPQELEEMIRYYLANPALRKEMSDNALQIIRQGEHTFLHRASIIADVLMEASTRPENRLRPELGSSALLSTSPPPVLVSA